MNTQHILFIGGGNMTRAIVSGLISNGYSAQSITVLDRHAEKCEFFARQYHVKTMRELPIDLSNIDVIVLSVKPQSAKEIGLQLQPLLQHQKPLVLSVMAGITIETLKSWLSSTISIVRAMPNTPALVKTGATGLFACSHTSEKQKQIAESLMSSIGITAWLENENQINAIIALSGSGPAYFFYLIEAMQNTAIQMGLPENIAKPFSIQTAYGAAKLALDSNETVSALRAAVTSKGGTTQAAIHSFQENNFPLLVENAMNSAKNRAEELSELLK